MRSCAINGSPCQETLRLLWAEGCLSVCHQPMDSVVYTCPASLRDRAMCALLHLPLQHMGEIGRCENPNLSQYSSACLVGCKGKSKWVFSA